MAYLDLYLVHWSESYALGNATDPLWNLGSDFRQFLQRLKLTWKAMEELVEMGLVGAIGVSNFTVQQIGKLLQFAKIAIAPAVNQVSLMLLCFIFGILYIHKQLLVQVNSESSYFNQ